MNQVLSEKTSSLLSSLGEKIKGKIKLEIPDNTWIKSPNINVELKGDLTLENMNNSFVINGWIKTGRGNLYYYGKKFTITKGELIFKDDTSLNPFINFNLEYSFRSPSG